MPVLFPRPWPHIFQLRKKQVTRLGVEYQGVSFFSSTVIVPDGFVMI